MSLPTKSDAGVTPKFGSVEDFRALTGLSVRGIYDRLASGELSAVKVGTRTLINIEKGLAWLESQPAAQIKPQVRRKLPRDNQHENARQSG